MVIMDTGCFIFLFFRSRVVVVALTTNSDFITAKGCEMDLMADIFNFKILKECST